MIALDAMGGDYAPHEVVRGAINAAQKGVPVALFGDEKTIQNILNSLNVGWWALPISINHSADVIGMGDVPTKSVLRKKESSLIRAIQSVIDGRASAVVTAGNSGAALVAGTLLIGCAPGVQRPALGNFLPTINGSVFCLDLGANADCKPEYLEQFALMGHVYVQQVMGIQRPRIALLSNGAEAYKGSMLVKETFTRLQASKSINFIGNLEPRELFEGSADVLVCDGFAGNIMLKTAQGTLKAIKAWLKEEANRSWKTKVGFALGSQAFENLKEKTDYATRGGALLLGLQRPLIVAHGSSNALAIENALHQAHKIVQQQTVPLFNKALAELIQETQPIKVMERKGRGVEYSRR